MIPNKKLIVPAIDKPPKWFEEVRKQIQEGREERAKNGPQEDYKVKR